MQIGMHELLCKAQEMIARKYPTILTDKSKRGEIKNYIAQFLYDTGYTVEGYSMKQVTDRLFSEMAEYSFLTAYQSLLHPASAAVLWKCFQSSEKQWHIRSGSFGVAVPCLVCSYCRVFMCLPF